MGIAVETFAAETFAVETFQETSLHLSACIRNLYTFADFKKEWRKVFNAL